jgi:hypothetical protein
MRSLSDEPLSTCQCVRRTDGHRRTHVCKSPSVDYSVDLDHFLQYILCPAWQDSNHFLASRRVLGVAQLVIRAEALRSKDRGFDSRKDPLVCKIRLSEMKHEI